MIWRDNKTGIPLDCGHQIWYYKPYPKPGEQAWCQRCNSYQTVLPVIPPPPLILVITIVDRKV